MRRIAHVIDPSRESARNALVKMHTDAESVPAYIRHAVKMLEKFLRQCEDGNIVDADPAQEKFPGAHLQLPMAGKAK